VAVAVFLHLRKPKGNLWDKLVQIDYLGSATLVSSVILLLLATNWGGSTYPWGGAIVVSLYVVSAILGTAFILIELYVAKQPIIRVRLFKIRNVALSCCIAFFAGFCLFGSFTYLPVYFQVVKGDSATTSGLRLLPLIIANVIVGISGGIFVSKTGRPTIPILVGAAMFVLGMGMLSLLGLHSSFGQMVGLLIPSGVAMGLIIQTLILAVQASVQKIDIANSTSAVTFFRSIGMVVGVACVGAVVTNHVSTNLNHNPVLIELSNDITRLAMQTPAIQLEVRTAFVKAIDLAFQVCIAFAGVGFILSLFLNHRKIKTEASAAPVIAE